MARSDERSQHGKKRAAEGDPDGAQPLTKRFNQLQLDNVPPSPGARARYHEAPTSTSMTTSTPNSTPLPVYPQAQGNENESMLLDDTEHTTYIYDLDRELADSDSPPGALVLLPLAERMLVVPDSVLSDDSKQGKELVLYSDPSSLSVPREQDSSQSQGQKDSTATAFPFKRYTTYITFEIGASIILHFTFGLG
ncbi:unnamed protein product [Penicillium manginii]